LRGLTVEEATLQLTSRYSEQVPRSRVEVLVLHSRGRTDDFFETLLSGPGGATREVVVTEEGTVELPLIAPISVLGRSPGEVRDRVRAAYTEVLSGVDVTTAVTARGRRKVAVLGAVNRAGVFDAPYPMSPLEAISLAGGLTGRAQRSQILVVHPEADGSVVARAVNLDDVLDGDDLSGLDATIYPHDLVFVPTSRIANVDAFVEQYIRGLMPIEVGAGVGWNVAN